MKIIYDPEVDAHHFPRNDCYHQAFGGRYRCRLSAAADEGRLAGLEILDAQKRFGGSETMRQVELEGVGT